jgi:Tfp pilus assembly protein PilV
VFTTQTKYNKRKRQGMRQSTQSKATDKEAGVVSLIVAMVMILVISLIVIGFTRVAVNNQRNTLDRQLSTQAFYAAESGVNSVITQIKAKQASDKPLAKQTNCAGVDYTHPALNGEDVKVTCILVDDQAENLQLSADQQSAKVVPIHAVDRDGATQNIASLEFTWTLPTASDPLTDLAGCPGAAAPSTLPKTSTCPFGFLRLDLYKPGGSMSATSMASSTASLVVRPAQSASMPAAVNVGSAVLADAACDVGTKLCRVILSGGNVFGGPDLYARISTYYKNAEIVTIDANTASGTYFTGAQAVIDVTAKAQDVLRRVRVRYPLVDYDKAASEGLSSAGPICKRYTVATNMFIGIDPNEAISTPDPGEELCDNASDPLQLLGATVGGNKVTAGFTAGGRTGTGGGPTPSYTFPLYGKNYTNTTPEAQPGAVASCLWQWGDGTPNTVSHTPIIAGDGCYQGQTINHVFSRSLNNQCYIATVSLTVTLVGGTTDTKSSPIAIPMGNDRNGVKKCTLANTTATWNDVKP